MFISRNFNDGITAPIIVNILLYKYMYNCMYLCLINENT